MPLRPSEGGHQKDDEPTIRSAPVPNATSSRTKFVNCNLVSPDGKVRLADLVVEDGVIAEIVYLNANERKKKGEDDGEWVDCQGNILGPGFIDLQLNGAYGIDFSNPNLTPSDVRTVASKLPQHGVTSFCPTLISCSTETYRKVIPVISSLCVSCGGSTERTAETRGISRKKRNQDDRPTEEEAFLGGANILCLHLEGPFFAPSKRGAHPAECILSPTEGLRTVRNVYGIGASLREAGVAIVTLAPELPGAVDAIKDMAEDGVVVSMGHTEATLEEGVRGVENGARLVTHLFNAMRGFHHREPGLLGLLTLDKSEVEVMGEEEKDRGKGKGDTRRWRRPHYSVIADGLHAHPVSVKLAHSVHPSGAVLITDAMSAMGLGDGSHTLGGTSVTIRGKRATVSGTETLAGSVSSMDDCVRSYRDFVGCTAGEAIVAATVRPAEVLGFERRKGRLEVGCDADLVLLDEEGLEVLGTWVRGRRVYDSLKETVDLSEKGGAPIDGKVSKRRKGAN